MRATIQQPPGPAGQDTPTQQTPTQDAAGGRGQGPYGPDPRYRDEPSGRAGSRTERARREPGRQPAVAGAVAALWALSVGLILLSLVVMLLWVLAPNSDGGAPEAWRGVGMVWLGAHQVPLVIGGRLLSLLPLGAVIPALLLLRRAGGWAARLVPRPSPMECLQIVLGGSTTYAAGAAAIAWLTAAAGTQADPARAGLVAMLVGALGLAWGLGRAVNMAGWFSARVPDPAWRVATGSVLVAVGLFAFGAAMLTSSLILQFHDMRASLGSLAPGGVGYVGLLVLCIAALPTMAIWWMSIALGPGVTLGAAGSLSAFGGELGRLPALPVFASLPASIPQAAAWLLLVPVLLGALAGRIRWSRDLPTAATSLTSALGLAAGTALLVGGMQRLALGSLGGQRMDQVGPLILPSMAIAAGLAALGFLIYSGLLGLQLNWQLHQRAVDAPPTGPSRSSRTRPSSTRTTAQAPRTAPAGVGVAEARPAAVPKRLLTLSADDLAGDREVVKQAPSGTPLTGVSDRAGSAAAANTATEDPGAAMASGSEAGRAPGPDVPGSEVPGSEVSGSEVSGADGPGADGPSSGRPGGEAAAGEVSGAAAGRSECAGWGPQAQEPTAAAEGMVAVAEAVESSNADEPEAS